MFYIRILDLFVNLNKKVSSIIGVCMYFKIVRPNCVKIKNILSWIGVHPENEYVPHLLIRQFSVQNSLINEKQKVYLDSSL